MAQSPPVPVTAICSGTVTGHWDPAQCHSCQPCIDASSLAVCSAGGAGTATGGSQRRAHLAAGGHRAGQGQPNTPCRGVPALQPCRPLVPSTGRGLAWLLMALCGVARRHAFSLLGPHGSLRRNQRHPPKKRCVFVCSKTTVCRNFVFFSSASSSLRSSRTRSPCTASPPRCAGAASTAAPCAWTTPASSSGWTRRATRTTTACTSRHVLAGRQRVQPAACACSLCARAALCAQPCQPCPRLLPDFCTKGHPPGCAGHPGSHRHPLYGSHAELAAFACI